jgi:TonB family protein
MWFHRLISRRETRGTRFQVYVWAGILGSLAIHVSLLKLLSHRQPPPQPNAFTVEFIPASTPAEAALPSIVSPPAPRAGEPPPTAYRSDSDNVVVREEVKRGDAPDAGAVTGRAPTTAAAPPPRAAAPRKERPEERPQKKSPPLKHLALDPATVIREFSHPPTGETRDDDPLAAPVGDYKAFSRPAGSGAAIVGLRGSNDYLPHLPDGDLTLLNTKANRFAVFVRRVATQVFGQLRVSGWEYLNAGDINRIDDHATVVATLTPAGELLEARLIASSGSRRFDEVVLAAVKKGARDPHPPSGAESPDGMIRFIFKSKSWVRLSADPRGPGFGERRWILLGTGLE